MKTMDVNEIKEFQMCPKFEKTFSILGKRWNGLIIDVLLLEGTQRFGELADKIPNISDRVLVERLKELESFGIVKRQEDSCNSKKVEYCLTEMGCALKPAMKEIQAWAETWIKLPS
ncbi:HxlR family transcriptional regulator [Vagococcus lutrae]|nr:HxlR family transcriptional regulator [Vagococcus lutrae]GEQ62676.1 HxlR family transcriptional regulator [Vagococcus lutrae]GEQ64546.1 HxlR family transcriptional regulator [Vagococcus lutrae]